MVNVDLTNAAVVGGAATVLTWALRSFVLPKMDPKVLCFVSAVVAQVVGALTGHVSGGAVEGTTNAVLAATAAGATYDKVLQPVLGSIVAKVSDFLHSFGENK